MYSKGDHRTSKYLMWPRRRSWIDQLQGSQSYPPFRSAGLNYAAHQEVSWEEQAFAEDTLMHVWPPRSYSCTFCRREFRSAQALGGHMNVHRRDRARLRQEEQSGSGPNSPAPADEQQSNPKTLPSDNHEVHNPPPPDNHKFSPSSVSVVNYPKPNDPNQLAAAQTVYDIEADEVLSVQKDLPQPAILVVGNLKRKDSHQVDDKLENYAAISTKRRCIVPAEFPFLSRPTLPIQLQKEVPMKSTTGSPIEELDLELRLGNCRPTVT